MTQKEFEKLSFDECQSLFGGNPTYETLEAWRAGYIYLKDKLQEMEKTAEDAFDFIDKVKDVCNPNLDWFKE